MLMARQGFILFSVIQYIVRNYFRTYHGLTVATGYAMHHRHYQTRQEKTSHDRNQDWYILPYNVSQAKRWVLESIDAP